MDNALRYALGRRCWAVCAALAVAVGAMISAGAPASAHAFLNESDPAAGQTLTAAPKVVRLTYSEQVQIAFSIFKVYKLNVASVGDPHGLDAAASAMTSEDLLKRGDESARADDGLANTTRTSTDIVVRLKDLAPGAYVLMWRALSVDTHTTQGSFWFIYAPTGSQTASRPVLARGVPLQWTGGTITAPLEVPATRPRLSVPVSEPFFFDPTDELTSTGPGGEVLDLARPALLALSWAGATSSAATPSLLPLEPSNDPEPSAGAVAAGELVRAVQAILQAQAPPSSAGGLPPNLQINGIMMYRLIYSPYPPTVGATNENDVGPSPQFPTINDGSIETSINWTLSPTLNIFADLTLENTTGVGFNSSDIEEAYLDAHDLFGVQGLRVRLGRDRLKLGFEGLLLDENIFDGGRRDGVEAAATQLGPLSVLGFMQYGPDDGLQLGNWSTSQRLWGGDVQVQVTPSWAFDVSMRADTADAADAGICPSTACNVGTGFSAGISGDLGSGVNLVIEDATYTQSGDVARNYFEPSLSFDLARLMGLPEQPVLTIWYKDFDPYTLPQDAPLGSELTPDDFAIWNTNDNLNGVGGRLDLGLSPALSVFGVAEWGEYKGGGPNYTVYSAGVKYSPTPEYLVKLSWNEYYVEGGTVTTSPISGLQLASTDVYLLELQRFF